MNILLLFLLMQNPNTAKYPSVTQADMPVIVNQAVTTLASAMLSTDTSISLTSGTKFPAPVIVTVDGEKILCTTVVTNTLSGCTRAYEGTIATNHALGTNVFSYIEQQQINQITAEILAIEAHPPSGGGGGGSGILYATDSSSGSTMAYSGSPAGCTSADLHERLPLVFSPTAQNTGTATFSYCSTTAVPIKNGDGSVLTLGQIPASPYSVMLLYHVTGPYWELLSALRSATSAEAGAGIIGNASITPKTLSTAINQNAPCSGLGTQFQVFTNTTGTNCLGSEPPTNPGGLRKSRTWLPDGTTSLNTSGMSLASAGCTPTAGAVTGPNSSQEVKFTASGTCIIYSAASPIWSGSQPKLDIGFRQVSVTNWFAGLVADSIKSSTSQLSGTYSGGFAAFRYNPSLGDTHIMCGSSVDGTSPVWVDSTVANTVNPLALRIFIDDVFNTVHFFNFNSEICISAWGGHLPAGVALSPQVGSTGGSFSIAYVGLGANQ